MGDIKWHPYPKEKPPKRVKSYLISLNDNGHPSVFVDTYIKHHGWKDYDGCTIVEPGWQFRSKVTAWAELPEPYRRNLIEQNKKRR